MRAVCVLIAGLVWATPGVRVQAQTSSAETAPAQPDSAFARFQRQQEQALDQFSQSSQEAFQAYRAADSLALAAFARKVEGKWGDYVGSTPTDWVEYGEGLNSRSRVDLEAGTVQVEVLSEGDARDVAAALRAAVARVVTDRGTSSDYVVELPNGNRDEPQPLGAEPVLAGQVAAADGTAVDAAHAADFAREVVAAATVATRQITGDDGRVRSRAAVRFALVPEHLRIRALRYQQLVHDQAVRFQLPAELVYAVIHTESAFNPKARSHVPAYGLMQLVPTAGGREAYRYVHHRDEVLPPSYFYVPSQNVELGCGYLDYLRHRPFGKLEDDEKALYCIIAAYNTGAGNVSRAFTGDTALRAAIPVIRPMTPERLYARLRAHLPYTETRVYLQHVVERMALYRDEALMEQAAP